MKGKLDVESKRTFSSRYRCWVPGAPAYIVQQQKVGGVIEPATVVHFTSDTFPSKTNLPPILSPNPCFST